MSATEPPVITALADAADASVVAAAVECLAAGGLLVMPTDTVYGLACRADDEAAIRRLFAAKQRPLSKALPLLLPSSNAMGSVAAHVDGAANRLAHAFWPGALTLVVRKSAMVSDLVTGGQPTVGVRVPDLALARAILAQCGFPVAVTSANLSDGDPACAVGELAPELLRQVSLVVDAGACPGAVPSTVIDLTQPRPVVLRQGPITDEQIAAALDG